MSIVFFKPNWLRFFRDRLLLWLLWLAGASFTQAQQGITVAGAGITGLGSTLNTPTGVYVDGSANLYVADQFNHRVQKWAPGATSGTTVAGTGTAGSGPDQLAYPTGVYVDGSGNVYISDQNNHRIQKWAPGATSGTTVAGTGTVGSGSDQFRNPTGVFVDGSGNLYVADQYNNRIQKFGPNSTSATSGTTVAGTGAIGSEANQLYYPTGVFVDGSGNLYVADQYNNRIQKFGPNSTSATSGTTVAGGNGYGAETNQIAYSKGVYVDGASNVYVADYYNNRIQKWVPGATRGTTVAGGASGLGPNQLQSPSGVFVDGSGNLYVADEYNNRVQKWASGATSGTTVAGMAEASQLHFPTSVFVDGSGNLYVADNANNRVQKWASGATSGTTVAGTGTAGSRPNQFRGSSGVFVDGSGNLYVVDQSNHRIQKFPPNSTSATNGTTVAGTGGRGSAPDQLYNPVGVFVDGSGAVYVADLINSRIQKWAPGATSGTTVAGGIYGSEANQLKFPGGVWVDGLGNLYVADRDNHRIQKWASGATSGTTVAGTGTAGSGANQLNGPIGVFVDGSGNVYVADQNNHRIQKWAPEAISGTTVAGTGTAGLGPNQLNFPGGLFVDGLGAVYVADRLNNRIQKFGPVSSPPVIVSQPVASSSVCTGAIVTAQISATAAGSITYQWYKTNLSSPVTGQTSATLTLSNVQTTDAGSYSAVVTSGGQSLTSTGFDLTVNAPPLVSLVASGSLTCTTTSVTLTASGGSTYQFSAGAIQIGSSSTATVSAAGVYSVTATGQNGCSGVASTTVTDDSQPILITQQPTNVSLTVGQTARFSVIASGTALTYQWQLNAGSGFVDLTNDATYSGVSSATLSVANTTTALSGYAYRVVVSSGVCSTSSTSATLTVAPLVADLVLLLYARPALLYGSSEMSVVVEVVELNGVASQGLITLKISQDAHLSLSLPASATSVGGKTVNNSVWQLSGPSGGYYTLTTSEPVAGGDKLSVGLVGQFRAGASTGLLPLSGTLVGGSGGEQRTNNNTDADKIEYFQQ